VLAKRCFSIMLAPSAATLVKISMDGIGRYVPALGRTGCIPLAQDL
jgi:hypothetical protein